MPVRRLPLYLLFVSGAALADDAALLKCRALPDSAARLGCYDAIPAGSPAAAPAAPAARQEAEPKSIESSIVGRFEGWGPGATIELANGQAWRVSDGSSAVLAPVQDPKARVVRNLFGTHFLEIEGTNSSPKVKRLR